VDVEAVAIGKTLRLSELKKSRCEKSAHAFGRNGDETRKVGVGGQEPPLRRAPVCTERSGGRLGGGRSGGVAPILDGQGETSSFKQEGQRRRRRYGTNVPPRQAGGIDAKAVRHKPEAS
jgi:hypothetical protein